MLKITAHVYVEPHAPDADPEDIATSFDLAIGSNLSGLPDFEEADIAKASVERIEVATEEDIEREGLAE